MNKQGRAIVTVGLSVLAAIGIALFITVNLSPLFIHVPSQRQIGLSPQQVRADYWRLIFYLQQPWPGQLQLRNIPLTTQAINHFGDVRRLLLIGEAVGFISLVGVLRLLSRQKRQGQLLRVLLPLKWLMYLLVMVAWLPLVNFSTDFIHFHQFVFHNHDWIFVPHRDPIILLMPERFFWHLLVILVILILGLLGILWGWLAIQLGLLKLRPDKTNNRWNQGHNDDRQNDN
ncbi:MAG TPA: TIGR01906 family membrane protein [Candidatus Limosilactobacillus intestinigallinarum]|nr:TIGR01906 family membrane protein [Candidatus Limosilactobacillus intestinigallinarum]